MELLNIINNVVIADKSAIKQSRTAKVVSARSLSFYQWLPLLLKNSGIDVIASENISLVQMAQTMGQRIIEMVILFADARTGVNFIKYLQETVDTVRSILPNVGILVVSTNPNVMMNSNLLPARTWMITPNSSPEEIKLYLLECRFAISNNNFFIRECSTGHPELILRRQHFDIKATIPNFNIKHPAMLVPIAMAAKRNNTPVFVEISPQEALVYYQASGKSIYEKLDKVFKSLKNDVEWVKNQTGAEIYLHLDHCNDIEIIKRTLDIGFNSVMADGSNQTLGANIRFVKSIKQLAEQYNVPVEGEVGAIDLFGFREKSTTQLSELEIFIDSTQVNYVGVNVRQFHGCDYGFDRSREAYLELQDLLKKQRYSARNLVEACLFIDNILSENDFPTQSLERQTLKTFTDEAIQINENQYHHLISSVLSDSPLSVAYWLNEALNEWHKRQIITTDKSRELFNSVLGFGIKDDLFKHKTLDFNLLAQIDELTQTRTSKIVLHGGSSINKDDLRFINKFDVRRVNFGSQTFKLFLNAVRAAKSGKYNFKDKPLNYNPIETAFFVNEFASDWKSWLDNYPSFLSEFEHEIDTLYFKPLLLKS